MASEQPYVQWHKTKRCWRFRRRIPDQLRDLIGQSEWVETLPARNRAEADRLAIPHIEETNRVIQLAQRGNWPPIGDDEIEALALGWWEWFQGEPIKRWIDRCGGSQPLDPHEWASAGEDDLSRSVRRFIAFPRVWFFPIPAELRPTPTRARVESLLAEVNRTKRLLRNADAMSRLLRQCRVLHHQCLGGFLGEIDERERAVARIMGAIHAQDADPCQIAQTIGERSTTTSGPPARTVPVPPPAPLTLPCSFQQLIDS